MVKIPVEGARGRISWKLERNPHGSKDPLVFPTEGAFRRWQRKRPWVTKVRKIPV